MLKKILRPGTFLGDLARYIRRFVRGLKPRTFFRNTKRRYLTYVDKKDYKKEFTKEIKNQRAITETAVVIHLYYTDQWPLFAKQLENLKPINYDLFVTIPKKSKNFKPTILDQHTGAVVLSVPNRGRDVLPFIKVLEIIKSRKYKYILKIHSKKSLHRIDGENWFKDMVGKLIPEDRGLLKRLQDVLSDKNTGIIGPEGHYVSLSVNFIPNRVGLNHVLYKITQKKQREKVLNNYKQYGFFAGTMFWARVDALLPVLKNNFDVKDFDIERGQIDATLAHALERAFCIYPQLKKRNMFEIGKDNFSKISYKTHNIPDWSEKLKNKPGN